MLAHQQQNYHTPAEIHSCALTISITCQARSWTSWPTTDKCCLQLGPQWNQPPATNRSYICTAWHKLPQPQELFNFFTHNILHLHGRWQEVLVFQEDAQI